MAEIEMARIKLNFYLLLSLFFCLGMTSQKNVLSPDESKVFRAWFVRIIAQQFIGGPTPRWTNRDCAGLVRFAANEAFDAPEEKGWTVGQTQQARRGSCENHPSFH